MNNVLGNCDFAFDCDSNSCLVRQLFVELLEKVLFIALSLGLGDQ